MIESVLAVENLEKICSIPGVNAVFVGPNDLTTNMGIPNEYDHPDLVAMIQRIIDVANRSHVAAGSWFGKHKRMERTIKQGSRFVVYSNDSACFASRWSSPSRNSASADESGAGQIRDGFGSLVMSMRCISARCSHEE